MVEIDPEAVLQDGSTTVITVCYAGLNKHFHMVWIQYKLHQSSGVALTTDQIWSHLRKLYDLDSLVSVVCVPQMYLEFLNSS